MELLVLLFLVWIVAVSVSATWGLRRAGFRKGQRPPSLNVSHEFDETALSATGGARVGRWNATFPLATLTADQAYIRIEIALMPTVWIPRDAVLMTHRVRTAGGSGVRFDTHDGQFDGVIFWTFQARRLLRKLDQLGWTVERRDVP